MGAQMNNTLNSDRGIELLVEKCRAIFRCPENTDFYDKDDYKEAERKYVKLCLSGRLDS
jgi:hypothetical protein